MNSSDYIKGRGAQINPNNRFNQFEQVREHWEGIDEDDSIDNKTKFIEVYPKTLVNTIKSPDLRMFYSMNPYQGCEHGCIYCYARPSHEYWGYSAGMDFEQTILVKKNAPELLEKALQQKNWDVKPISLSGNTDCYQPCERQFGITRELLKKLLFYKHPVGIITKNTLIKRDLDLLIELAQLKLVSVNISLTSLQEDLRQKLEPRTATAKRKLELIELFSNHNIPVRVMIAPIVPALNDNELIPIMKTASEHGALDAHYQIVRLNGANKIIFKDWLSKNFPDRAAKVIHQLEDIHGGDISNSQFGKRLKGEGHFAQSIRQQYQIAKQKYFKQDFPALRTDLFTRPPENGQMVLFE